jgi:LytS/YehU family sensor histidine kinase
MQSPQAPKLIKKLSDLMHYMMSDCNKPLVPLHQELKTVKDYIDLERARYGEKLNLKICVNGDPGNKLIAPLLLIPFIENSFKHGASKVLSHPWVNLNITILPDELQMALSNSKPEGGISNDHTGIGLSNTIKRLDLLYPNSFYSLHVNEEMLNFNVLLKIKLEEEINYNKRHIRSPLKYEWA